jgi:Na+/H+-dicarboxylate symporter
MSLSKPILMGLIGGLAVGLLFGEKASFLELPARAFIQR